MAGFDLPGRTAEAARDIESMDNPGNHLRKQAIDIEVTSNLQGRVKEVTVYYHTRNIKVGVDLYGSTVTGYSHGRHAVPILDEDCETLLKHLGDELKSEWEYNQ